MLFKVFLSVVLFFMYFLDIEVEDIIERKLELLYGVSFFEWCVYGIDFLGIYKEIVERISNLCDDFIDISGLFFIFMVFDFFRD